MAAALEQAMAAAMPDFKFLLDREGVPADLQAKIYEAGVANLQQFAAFVPDADALRKWKTLASIPPQGSRPRSSSLRWW